MYIEHIPEVVPNPAMLVLASTNRWCENQCIFTAEGHRESTRKGRVTVMITMGTEGISSSGFAWKAGFHF